MLAARHLYVSKVLAACHLYVAKVLAARHLYVSKVLAARHLYVSKVLAAHHLYVSKVLAARKKNLTTFRARKNKHTIRMLANARKDHSILLIQFEFTACELRMKKSLKIGAGKLIASYFVHKKLPFSGRKNRFSAILVREMSPSLVLKGIP